MTTSPRVLGRAIALAAFVALSLLAPAAGAVVVRTSVAYRPVYHPVARPAAVVGVGAAVATGVAVGTVVRSLPPSCSAFVAGGVAYRRCGSVWYRPVYSGTTLTYTVVSPPR